MMLKLAKLGIAIAAVATLIVPAAFAGVPDVTQSYFVPQSGSVASPVEGAAALANFRHCPNNDGVGVLSNNARLKVVVRASDGSPIANIPAADIYLKFNGGTLGMGFSGSGADSVIATNALNPIAGCPDIRFVTADAPTNAEGVAYITLWGGTYVSGNATRDSFRKWGGYDGNIPLFVLGSQLNGYLTTVHGITPNFTMHLKSFDFQGGYTTTLNQGEVVNSSDYSPVRAAIGGTYRYNNDFQQDGTINSADISPIIAHFGHDCDTPNNP